MERQDLNGYRTPEEVVRRWDLSKIELNSEDIEKIKQDIICDDHLSTTSTAPVQNKVVTAAINNKVTKVPGKGLSENDFTDEDKASIHTHSNKSALDTITTEKINQWDSNSFSIDSVYPIGSIYMNINSTNPSTLFPGTTWTALPDMFLLGAGTTYPGNSTGGEDKHRHKVIIGQASWFGLPLTESEYGIYTKDENGNTTIAVSQGSRVSVGNRQRNSALASAMTSFTHDGFGTETEGYTHYSSNMPPFRTVYMWQRTA